MLPLVDAMVGETIIALKSRLIRRLGLYIASSAASRITLSQRPEEATSSSLVDCFLRILSGRFSNHDTSGDDTDECRVVFRSRDLAEPLVDDCLEGLTVRGCLSPRRSARDAFLLTADPPSKSDGVELEFCANRSRSNVEKYCRSGN
jgi:hypothetical protein